MALSTWVSPIRYSVWWPHRELHRRPSGKVHMRFPPHVRGPMGSSTEGPSVTVRMRLPHLVQRFVAS
eukprot:2207636-Pyramimonas_sp.AAC.1